MALLHPRRTTRTVRVGDLAIGSGHPIRVQTMTKGDTGAVIPTFDEIVGLEATGCELVRVSVPTMREAKALGEIKRAAEQSQVAWLWKKIGNCHERCTPPSRNIRLEVVVNINRAINARRLDGRIQSCHHACAIDHRGNRFGFALDTV